MEEIINILKNDDKLKNLLNASSEDFHIEALSYSGDSLPAIVYSETPLNENTSKQFTKLELRVIATTLGEGEEISNRIKKLLLTEGDKPLTNNILSVEINGGGVLEYKEQHNFQIFNYFNIARRK